MSDNGRYNMPFTNFDAPVMKDASVMAIFDNIIVEAGAFGGGELGPLGVLRFHFSSSSGVVLPPIDFVGDPETIENVARIVSDAGHQAAASARTRWTGQ